MESAEEEDLIKTRAGRDASFFDLCSIDQLNNDDIGLIFALARRFRHSQTYNLKVIVVRAKESGVPEFLSRHVRAGIINAGDGWHEHPTQALLDALTMLDHFKGKDLKGRTVTVVGDIMHSRVFGSLVRMMKK